MSKKILCYTVNYYRKHNKLEIYTGFICISPHFMPAWANVLATIDKPEYIALLMDTNNTYDFVVVSGEPFYQETNKNELIQPKIENKGIVYDSVRVGLFMSLYFRWNISAITSFDDDKVEGILINASIYFLQWHSNRKNTDKAKGINRTVLYLHTLRYLKEKHNINLIQ